MNIKELFEKSENGMLTYEQFEAMSKEQGAKFADLSSGNYVSKSKYDADLKAKDTQMDSLNGQITTLNETIATRDTDLAGLKSQLEAAGQDATKLAELNSQFTGLQSKYDADIKQYEQKMQQQAYEFAVREFANTKKFTSQAAKRDFTQAMIQKGLQMENGKLIGGEDFVGIYSQDNADAFYVEPPKVEPEPTPEPAPAPVPTITTAAPGISSPTGDDAQFSFNFTGVRAH